jgi:hypothetical protein
MEPNTWAPDACTLPTAEQPLRLAEFDALFRTALRAAGRTGPTRLRLTLDGSPEVEATARDLTARESQCCSFFTFSFSRTEDGRLLLDVTVPERHTEVLDGLAARTAGTRR